MSLFGPRFYSAPEPNFSGLFRLIDDFDKYSQQSGGQPGARGGRHIPTFTPKFDVKETEHAYELHGELPGIERDNVHLEFTEPQSLTVRGKVERSYSEGEPPAGLLEEGRNNNGGNAIEAGEKSHGSPKPHPVTVEDDAEEGTVAKTNNNKDQQQVQQHNNNNNKPQKPAPKYWVSERSIGEFSRTFSFPTRVDSDNVSASLNNGILTVTVPKAKKHESKRISVS